MVSSYKKHGLFFLFIYQLTIMLSVGTMCVPESLTEVVVPQVTPRRRRRGGRGGRVLGSNPCQGTSLTGPLTTVASSDGTFIEITINKPPDNHRIRCMVLKLKCVANANSCNKLLWSVDPNPTFTAMKEVKTTTLVTKIKLKLAGLTPGEEYYPYCGTLKESYEAKHAILDNSLASVIYPIDPIKMKEKSKGLELATIGTETIGKPTSTSIGAGVVGKKGERLRCIASSTSHIKDLQKMWSVSSSDALSVYDIGSLKEGLNIFTFSNLNPNTKYFVDCAAVPGQLSLAEVANDVSQSSQILMTTPDGLPTLPKAKNIATSKLMTPKLDGFSVHIDAPGGSRVRCIVRQEQTKPTIVELWQKTEENFFRETILPVKNEISEDVSQNCKNVCGDIEFSNLSHHSMYYVWCASGPQIMTAETIAVSGFSPSTSSSSEIMHTNPSTIKTLQPGVPLSKVSAEVLFFQGVGARVEINKSSGLGQRLRCVLREGKEGKPVKSVSKENLWGETQLYRDIESASGTDADYMHWIGDNLKSDTAYFVFCASASEGFSTLQIAANTALSSEPFAPYPTFVKTPAQGTYLATAPIIGEASLLGLTVTLQGTKGERLRCVATEKEALQSTSALWMVKSCGQNIDLMEIGAKAGALAKGHVNAGMEASLAVIEAKGSVSDAAAAAGKAAAKAAKDEGMEITEIAKIAGEAASVAVLSNTNQKSMTFKSIMASHAGHAAGLAAALSLEESKMSDKKKSAIIQDVILIAGGNKTQASSLILQLLKQDTNKQYCHEIIATGGAETIIFQNLEQGSRYFVVCASAKYLFSPSQIALEPLLSSEPRLSTPNSIVTWQKAKPLKTVVVDTSSISVVGFTVQVTTNENKQRIRCVAAQNEAVVSANELWAKPPSAHFDGLSEIEETKEGSASNNVTFDGLKSGIKYYITCASAPYNGHSWMPSDVAAHPEISSKPLASIPVSVTLFKSGTLAEKPIMHAVGVDNFSVRITGADGELVRCIISKSFIPTNTKDKKKIWEVNDSMYYKEIIISKSKSDNADTDEIKFSGLLNSTIYYSACASSKEKHTVKDILDDIDLSSDVHVATSVTNSVFIKTLSPGSSISSILLDSPTSYGFKVYVTGEAGEQLRCVATIDQAIASPRVLWGNLGISGKFEFETVEASGKRDGLIFKDLSPNTKYYVTCASAPSNFSRADIEANEKLSSPLQVSNPDNIQTRPLPDTLQSIIINEDIHMNGFKVYIQKVKNMHRFRCAASAGNAVGTPEAIWSLTKSNAAISYQDVVDQSNKMDVKVLLEFDNLAENTEYYVTCVAAFHELNGKVLNISEILKHTIYYSSPVKTTEPPMVSTLSKAVPLDHPPTVKEESVTLRGFSVIVKTSLSQRVRCAVTLLQPLDQNKGINKSLPQPLDLIEGTNKLITKNKPEVLWGLGIEEKVLWREVISKNKNEDTSLVFDSLTEGSKYNVYCATASYRASAELIAKFPNHSSSVVYSKPMVIEVAMRGKELQSAPKLEKIVPDGFTVIVPINPSGQKTRCVVFDEKGWKYYESAAIESARLHIIWSQENKAFYKDFDSQQDSDNGNFHSLIFTDLPSNTEFHCICVRAQIRWKPSTLLEKTYLSSATQSSYPVVVKTAVKGTDLLFKPLLSDVTIDGFSITVTGGVVGELLRCVASSNADSISSAKALWNTTIKNTADEEISLIQNRITSASETLLISGVSSGKRFYVSCATASNLFNVSEVASRSVLSSSVTTTSPAYIKTLYPGKPISSLNLKDRNLVGFTAAAVVHIGDRIRCVATISTWENSVKALWEFISKEQVVDIPEAKDQHLDILFDRLSSGTKYYVSCASANSSKSSAHIALDIRLSSKIIGVESPTATITTLKPGVDFSVPPMLHTPSLNTLSVRVNVLPDHIVRCVASSSEVIFKEIIKQPGKLWKLENPNTEKYTQDAIFEKGLAAGIIESKVSGKTLEACNVAAKKVIGLGGSHTTVIRVVAFVACNAATLNYHNKDQIAIESMKATRKIKENYDFHEIHIEDIVSAVAEAIANSTIVEGNFEDAALLGVSIIDKLGKIQDQLGLASKVAATVIIQNGGSLAQARIASVSAVMSLDRYASENEIKKAKTKAEELFSASRLDVAKVDSADTHGIIDVVFEDLYPSKSYFVACASAPIGVLPAKIALHPADYSSKVATCSPPKLTTLAPGTALTESPVAPEDEASLSGFSVYVTGTVGERIQCIATINRAVTSAKVLWGDIGHPAKVEVEAVEASGKKQSIVFKDLSPDTEYYLVCASASDKFTATQVSKNSALSSQLQSSDPPTIRTLKQGTNVIVIPKVSSLKMYSFVVSVEVCTPGDRIRCRARTKDFYATKSEVWAIKDEDSSFMDAVCDAKKQRPISLSINKLKSGETYYTTCAFAYKPYQPLFISKKPWLSSSLIMTSGPSTTILPGTNLKKIPKLLSSPSYNGFTITVEKNANKERLRCAVFPGKQCDSKEKLWGLSKVKNASMFKDITSGDEGITDVNIMFDKLKQNTKYFVSCASASLVVSNDDIVTNPKLSSALSHASSPVITVNPPKGLSIPPSVHQITLNGFSIDVVSSKEERVRCVASLSLSEVNTPTALWSNTTFQEVVNDGLNRLIFTGLQKGKEYFIGCAVSQKLHTAKFIVAHIGQMSQMLSTSVHHPTPKSIITALPGTELPMPPSLIDVSFVGFTISAKCEMHEMIRCVAQSDKTINSVSEFWRIQEQNNAIAIVTFSTEGSATIYGLASGLEYIVVCATAQKRFTVEQIISDPKLSSPLQVTFPHTITTLAKGSGLDTTPKLLNVTTSSFSLNFIGKNGERLRCVAKTHTPIKSLSEFWQVKDESNSSKDDDKEFTVSQKVVTIQISQTGILSELTFEKLNAGLEYFVHCATSQSSYTVEEVAAAENNGQSLSSPLIASYPASVKIATEGGGVKSPINVEGVHLSGFTVVLLRKILVNAIGEKLRCAAIENSKHPNTENERKDELWKSSHYKEAFIESEKDIKLTFEDIFKVDGVSYKLACATIDARFTTDDISRDYKLSSNVVYTIPTIITKPIQGTNYLSSPVVHGVSLNGFSVTLPTNETSENEQHRCVASEFEVTKEKFWDPKAVGGTHESDLLAAALKATVKWFEIDNSVATCATLAGEFVRKSDPTAVVAAQKAAGQAASFCSSELARKNGKLVTGLEAASAAFNAMILEGSPYVAAIALAGKEAALSRSNVSGSTKELEASVAGAAAFAAATKAKMSKVNIASAVGAAAVAAIVAHAKRQDSFEISEYLTAAELASKNSIMLVDGLTTSQAADSSKAAIIDTDKTLAEIQKFGNPKQFFVNSIPQKGKPLTLNFTELYSGVEYFISCASAPQGSTPEHITNHINLSSELHATSPKGFKVEVLGTKGERLRVGIYESTNKPIRTPSDLWSMSDTKFYKDLDLISGNSITNTVIFSGLESDKEYFIVAAFASGSVSPQQVHDTIAMSSDLQKANPSAIFTLAGGTKLNQMPTIHNLTTKGFTIKVSAKKGEKIRCVAKAGSPVGSIAALWSPYLENFQGEVADTTSNSVELKHLKSGVEYFIVCATALEKFTSREVELLPTLSSALQHTVPEKVTTIVPGSGLSVAPRISSPEDYGYSVNIEGTSIGEYIRCVATLQQLTDVSEFWKRVPSEFGASIDVPKTTKSKFTIKFDNLKPATTYFTSCATTKSRVDDVVLDVSASSPIKISQPENLTTTLTCEPKSFKIDNKCIKCKTTCKLGYFFKTPCVVNADATCEVCTPNEKCITSDTETTCVDGNLFCKRTLPGYYLNDGKVERCNKCNSNQYMKGSLCKGDSKTNSMHCTNCEAHENYTCGKNARRIGTCGSGEADYSCVTCPRCKYLDEPVNLVCDDIHYCADNCKKGYFVSTSSHRCEKCAQQENCFQSDDKNCIKNGGPKDPHKASCLQAKHGYYADKFGNVLKCLSPTSCSESSVAVAEAVQRAISVGKGCEGAIDAAISTSKTFANKNGLVSSEVTSNVAAAAGAAAVACGMTPKGVGTAAANAAKLNKATQLEIATTSGCAAAEAVFSQNGNTQLATSIAIQTVSEIIKPDSAQELSVAITAVSYAIVKSFLTFGKSVKDIASSINKSVEVLGGSSTVGPAMAYKSATKLLNTKRTTKWPESINMETFLNDIVAATSYSEDGNCSNAAAATGWAQRQTNAVQINRGDNLTNIMFSAAKNSRRYASEFGCDDNKSYLASVLSACGVAIRGGVDKDILPKVIAVAIASESFAGLDQAHAAVSYVTSSLGLEDLSEDVNVYLPTAISQKKKGVLVNHHFFSAKKYTPTSKDHVINTSLYMTHSKGFQKSDFDDTIYPPILFAIGNELQKTVKVKVLLEHHGDNINRRRLNLSSDSLSQSNDHTLIRRRKLNAQQVKRKNEHEKAQIDQVESKISIIIPFTELSNTVTSDDISSVVKILVANGKMQKIINKVGSTLGIPLLKEVKVFKTDFRDIGNNPSNHTMVIGDTDHYLDLNAVSTAIGSGEIFVVVLVVIYMIVQISLAINRYFESKTTQKVSGQELPEIEIPQFIQYLDDSSQINPMSMEERFQDTTDEAINKYLTSIEDHDDSRKNPLHLEDFGYHYETDTGVMHLPSLIYHLNEARLECNVEERNSDDDDHSELSDYDFDGEFDTKRNDVEVIYGNKAKSTKINPLHQFY